MIERIYLTRRNLNSLLKKLDDPTLTPGILKQDLEHPDYPGTVRCMVIAIEDERYYTDREPGRLDSDD